MGSHWSEARWGVLYMVICLELSGQGERRCLQLFVACLRDAEDSRTGENCNSQGPCIETGSDVSRFNDSLMGAGGGGGRDSVHGPQLLKRKESRSGIERTSNALVKAGAPQNVMLLLALYRCRWLSGELLRGESRWDCARQWAWWHSLLWQLRPCHRAWCLETTGWEAGVGLHFPEQLQILLARR